jgi:hypothetical protein
VGAPGGGVGTHTQGIDEVRTSCQKKALCWTKNAAISRKYQHLFTWEPYRDGLLRSEPGLAAVSSIVYRAEARNMGYVLQTGANAPRRCVPGCWECVGMRPNRAPRSRQCAGMRFPVYWMCPRSAMASNSPTMSFMVTSPTRLPLSNTTTRRRFCAIIIRATYFTSMFCGTIRAGLLDTS